ncbi:MAG: hypothetical protein LBR14_04815 [Clostridiales Family XIII bacterium]|nr:hypothetical protein [Clostridiales Family XIII bacterium]
MTWDSLSHAYTIFMIVTLVVSIICLALGIVLTIVFNKKQQTKYDASGVAQQNYAQQQAYNQAVAQGYYAPPPKAVEPPNLGFAILSFFFGIVGLILFCVWNREQPFKAKSAGIGALVGVITSFVEGIIIVVLLFIFLMPYFDDLGDLFDDIFNSSSYYYY